MLSFLFRLKKSLFLLVSVLSQAFFALVRRHLVSLVFLTVWHNMMILRVDSYLTAFMKVLAGLKAGILWAGMVMATFLPMLRPVFSALVLMI